MTNVIIIAIVAVILGAAIGYIIKEKKRGTVCIGCPSSGTCSASCSDCNGSCGQQP